MIKKHKEIDPIIKELRDLIKTVSDEIQPKLLPKPGHPTRIARPHLYGMIKEICNATYSEADPNKVRAVIEAIRKEPNGNLKEIFNIAKEIYKENRGKNESGTTSEVISRNT